VATARMELNRISSRLLSFIKICENR